jgi:hypothetical protein
LSTAWIIAFATMSIVVLILALLVIGTLRRLDQLLTQVNAALATAMERIRRDGLQPGSRVGSFSATRASGGRYTEQDLLGTMTLVLFLNSSCASCHLLAEDLRTGSAPDLGVRLVVVADDLDEARSFLASEQVTVLIQDADLVARAFDSHRTPHSFLVNELGVALAAGTPNTWAQIRGLISESNRRANQSLSSGTIGVAS